MSSARKKVIISACLLGERCRYDGKTKEVNAVIEAYKEYEIIPFCPEAPLFGTPRERINVIEVDGENRIITDETNIDVTESLEKEIHLFCSRYPKVDAIVLKSKSPSCGYKTTPILNKNKELIKVGDGIAAQIFQKYYKNITIQNELSF
ncbi:DUF523 domain-containing protein [Sulfurimonas sp. SAG-AH-194-L11]|nr:DUF523 domain-containing protein [Sulfurimonas sp. SAG-AH-194-L11]MDF1877051.1 DUF523 domain-containing protein [Sulfurimonas sp. SAG-AH-194-L11]